MWYTRGTETVRRLGEAAVLWLLIERRRRIVVYSTALERRHTARYREFESLRLRSASNLSASAEIFKERSDYKNPSAPDQSRVPPPLSLAKRLVL